MGGQILMPIDQSATLSVIDAQYKFDLRILSLSSLMSAFHNVE